MTIGDWLIIFAVFSGPIVAVQVQKRLEDWREKKNRKLGIFESLMTTRGNTVSERHVEALNMIDLEFNVKEPKEKEVVDSWNVYRDHLYSAPQDYEDPSYQSEFRSWAQKSTDHLTDLLYCMSESLGYEFDKVLLKKGFYTPQRHADLELERSYIRRGLINVLYGRSAVAIEPFQAQQQDLEKNKPETEKDGN